MNQLLVFSTLLSVFAVSFSALAGNNRYGAPHTRNSLNYRGGSRYPSAHQPGRAPLAAQQSYGAPRSVYGVRQSAPGPYAGGRHFSGSGVGVNQYSGPVPYAAGPGPYGGQVHASGGATAAHFSSSKRSVYQPQESAYSSSSRSNYPQQSYGQQHAESRAQTHGREMKYTIRDPQNRGTTHVTETHVVSNRQMHGAEAEAAMKKLMGSMGPASDNGFHDFVKGMGIPFY